MGEFLEMHQVFKRGHPTSKYTHDKETELVVRDPASKTNWGSFGITVEIFKSYQDRPLFIDQADQELKILCHSSAGTAGVNCTWLNCTKCLKNSNI